MSAKDYWTQRARRDKIKVIKEGEQGIDNLKRILKTNLDDVEKKISQFYEKYGNNPAERLTYAEFEEYKKRLVAMAKKYPKDKTLQKLAKQDIPKYKIDRLRSLQTDLQIALTEATAGQESGIYKTLEDVGRVSETLLVNRFKKEFGLEFNTIASRKMKQLLMSDWSGANWSQRLWKDRELVGQKVQDILERGVPQGASMQRMARELKHATGESFNNAFRLIRTETSHIDGQVKLEYYKKRQEEKGRKLKYKYDAFLDSRTSKICKELDNKTFWVDDAEVGKNFPPMHPNCRSTTQLVLDEDEITERKETLTENPQIDEKLVKGHYNDKEIEQLKSISNELKQLGYEPSGHAIQRAFERNIKPSRIDDVIRTGRKYTDGTKATGFYKNRVSVQISKETGQIKTVIYYNKNDTPPLKRNRNAKRKK